MAASKVMAIDKNMFSVGIKVAIVASIEVTLICLYVTIWRTRSSHLEGFCKKSVFENFTKITKSICARVFFSKKIQAGGLQLYYKETPLLVFFCKFCEIFKNTYFQNVCERLLSRVRSLRVSFRQGFYCVNYCFI